ncbi:MAG TPA: VWA domain-containing protein [Candidatus Sulfotelmatobacter sp.]|jgi:Ca-activated chloride channel family protein
MKSSGGRTRVIWALPCLCAAVAIAPQVLQAQDATFHVDVKLVNIFVNVTDKNGAIIGDLSKDDFAVFEDNRPQQITLFERKTDVPLNLTLAIDTSGSVRKDLDEESAAARKFAHDILEPKDQMSVLEFATDVSELTSFTNNLLQIDRAMGHLRTDSATALYDAIVLGSQGLGKCQGRKVLVLVSDGDDTAKSSTYDQALEAALRNEVMIYSLIDVPISASAGRDTGGEHALIALSEETGGKYFYVGEGGLDKAFAKVSDDLRTQYLIGYYPQHQAPGLNFHRVVVTVPRAAADQFNVRNKAGYYADAKAKDN